MGSALSIVVVAMVARVALVNPCVRTDDVFVRGMFFLYRFSSGRWKRIEV